MLIWITALMKAFFEDLTCQKIGLTPRSKTGKMRTLKNGACQAKNVLNLMRVGLNIHPGENPLRG